MIPEIIIFTKSISIIWFISILVLVIIMNTFKGIALWLSAKRKQKGWFIFLFIFSAGILPIIYLIINPGRKKK